MKAPAPPDILPPPHWSAAPPPPLPPFEDNSSGGPLTQEHLRQLEQANRRAARIRKAAGVAAFNGWTIGFFAAGALLVAMVALPMGEIDGLSWVMAVGLGIVARNEFRGRGLLRRLDSHGPRLLGWNQLGLMVLLIAYCGWQIAAALLGPNPYAEAIAREPMLEPMLGNIGKLYANLTIAVYGGMIVGTLLFQGLTARYYFTRGKHLRAYLAETPEWVLQVQRRSA